MNRMRLVLLGIPLYGICLASVGFLAWLIADAHSAVADGAASVPMRTGLRYLALPLALPALHLMGVVEHLWGKAAAGAVRRYGNLIAVAAFLVPLVAGWFIERHYYFAALESAGYEACRPTGGGIRSTRLLYVLPGTSCEEK